MKRRLLLVPGYLLRVPGESAVEGAQAVLVDGSTIAAVAPRASLAAPDAEQIELPNCLIMPGLVNAHQHGRGISQIQLGYPDARLELWINQRRARGAPDPYPLALLAAAEMLRHGVTCAVHANISYGSGDYEQEVRAGLRAYIGSGLRVTMCVGAADRGLLVYPHSREADFLNGLPAPLRDAVTRPAPPPYAGDAAATIALMDRLVADFAGEPRVRFCYGPAGPQWASDELFSAIARDAERRELGIHLHALESEAQAAACRELYPEGTLERLRRLGIVGPRTAVAHGVHLSDADMAILARGDATVVTNPGSNLRLGNGVARVTAMLERGVRVAVGTDNTALADDEDLLTEGRLAATLARGGTWAANPPPTPPQILAMLTMNGARAAQWADCVGRIEQGFKADLIALTVERIVTPYLDPDTKVLETIVARASGRDVRLTMVDGEILYRDGRFAHLDLDDIHRAARAAAQAARLSPDPHAVAMGTELRFRLARFYEELVRS